MIPKRLIKFLELLKKRGGLYRNLLDHHYPCWGIQCSMCGYLLKDDLRVAASQTQTRECSMQIYKELLKYPGVLYCLIGGDSSPRLKTGASRALSHVRGNREGLERMRRERKQP